MEADFRQKKGFMYRFMLQYPLFDGKADLQQDQQRLHPR